MTLKLIAMLLRNSKTPVDFGSWYHFVVFAIHATICASKERFICRKVSNRDINFAWPDFSKNFSDFLR